MIDFFTMKILGIETSCDETAVALVENGTRVIKNIIYSQIDLHAETGGVVPEVAAREHILKIIPALSEFDMGDFDAISVTNRPGLISSLLTGTVTASTMALVLNKPIIPVNHIHGHIYANWLGRDADDFEFPIVILTVSGGHNELVLMRGHSDFEVVGETLDDAAGEAFDKVARMLDLGYPGGPVVSRVALEGDASKYDLPRAWLGDGVPRHNRKHTNNGVPLSGTTIDNDPAWAGSGGDVRFAPSLDFSFSGLKTAVSRLPLEDTANVAASFQEAVCDVLSAKLKLAAERFGAREVHLAGGVSANKRLREMVAERISLPVKWPEKIEYCTDNGAMIAAAGYFQFKKSPEKYTEWNNVGAQSW